MSLTEELKETGKFFLIIIASALSSAGMVLIVNNITQHLPKTQDIIMTTIIGFTFITIGTLLGYFAGKKMYGILP